MWIEADQILDRPVLVNLAHVATIELSRYQDGKNGQIVIETWAPRSLYLRVKPIAEAEEQYRVLKEKLLGAR